MAEKSRGGIKSKLLFLAIILGVVNALVLYVFEFVGVEVTNWLWNDVLRTDLHRWRVVPVALVLGLALTGVIKLLHSKRVVSLDKDLLTEIKSSPTTLFGLSAVLVIGVMCLVAGGSIGPEASLMLASAGIGLYAARRWQLDDAKQLIMLASISALLVAFIDSMVLVLIPLLLLVRQSRQQHRRPPLGVIVPILLASIVSFLVIHAIDQVTHHHGGYGTGPTLPLFVAKDLAVAIGLGFASALLGRTLNWTIQTFWQGAHWLDQQRLPLHDWLIGLIFSAGLAFIYLLGGPTIQFSGSIGIGLLTANTAQYGVLALVGLVITKLLATAWSKSTGYRGGLVFPSLYIGVALGLLAGHIFSGVGGAGAIVGGMAGMLTAAVDSPAIGSIFLLAVLPWHFWPLGLCAILGTVIFGRIFTQLKINKFQP